MAYRWLIFALEALVGIEPFEVMQMLTDKRPRRPRPNVDPATGIRVIEIEGTTRAGRYIVATVRPVGGFDSVILHAREMTTAEKTSFDEWEVGRD